MIERWTAEGQPVPATAPATPPVHATALHGEPTESAAPEVAAADSAVPADKPTKKPRVKSKWGGRVGWLSAMVTMGVFLGLVIILGLKFIDGPVSTTQSKTLTQLQASGSPSPAMNMLDSLYAELKYPGIFDQVGRSKGGVNTLEAYVLSSKSSYARTIAVDISNLPSNVLEDDSSYKFRIMSRELYTEVKTTVQGEPVSVLQKGDKSERTLFWAHKGHELTVSLTTDNPGKDDLEAYLKAILPTIKWRQ